MKVVQVWVCPRCGWTYESPKRLTRAYCPRHLGGALRMVEAK